MSPFVISGVLNPRSLINSERNLIGFEVVKTHVIDIVSASMLISILKLKRTVSIDCPESTNA